MPASPVRVLLFALLAAGTAAAQLPTGEPPNKRRDPLNLGPAYTAFPDLKPPFADVVRAKPEERERAWADYEKALDKLVFDKLPTQPPKDATPLQKVLFEQVRSGAAHIQTMRELIKIGRWDSDTFKEYMALTADTFRAAAELAPNPADRVPYFEARVILFKDTEALVEIRIAAGTDPLPNVYLARFSRLQAEAELLKLKESLKGGK